MMNGGGLQRIINFLSVRVRQLQGMEWLTTGYSFYAALLGEASSRDEHTLLKRYCSLFHLMGKGHFLREAGEFRGAIRLPR